MDLFDIYTDCKLKIILHTPCNDEIRYEYTDEEFKEFSKLLESNLYGMSLNRDNELINEVKPDLIICININTDELIFLKDFLQKIIYSNTVMEVLGLYNLDDRQHAMLYSHVMIEPSTYLESETTDDGILTKLYFSCRRYEGKEIQKVADRIFNNNEGFSNEHA